jgi:hypothetical protein
MSSDALDITARLNAKNQLWRHRSENNLREPSRRIRAGQREHCQGHLLSHLTPFHLRLSIGTPEPEPTEECDLDDEQRLHESNVVDSE